MKAALLTALILYASAVNARDQSLPIPPIPPSRPPTTDAPVPNLDAAIPYSPLSQSLVTLDVDINHRAAPTPGYGYSPGAHYQLDNDRRPFVLPGLMMHVPLP